MLKHLWKFIKKTTGSTESLVQEVISNKGKIDKFRSLTATLAFAFLILSVIILVVFSLLNTYSNYRNNTKVIAEHQHLLAKEAANTVKSFIQEKFRMLLVATSVGDLVTATQERQKQVLSRLLGLDPAFRQIVLLNTQGNDVLRVSRLTRQMFGQLTEQHKKEIITRMSPGKTYISSIYIDDKTYEPVVIMAVPIATVLGEIEGILVSEINLKFMWDLVGSMKIGKKGLAYVVDRKGDLIAFGDVSRVLKGENLIRLKEVAEFANRKESGAGDTKVEISKGIQGTKVVATYVPLGNPDWAVLVELPVTEAYELVIQGIIISILIMLLSFVLAIIAGFFLARRITKPIIDLRNATQEISKGNLETRIQVDSNDEIGQLAANFNQMVLNLSSLVTNTKQAIKVILEQSLFLKDSSNQSAQSAEAVAVAMEQISQGTVDQTSEAEKTSLQTEKLVKEIDAVVVKAMEVENITNSTKELSLKSKDAVQFLILKAKETDKITRLFTKNINKLNNSVEKIRGITEVIAKVTERTNLLALNASIEAARAGEAGRGFAVVASEINNLANQSRDAAKTIDIILKGIQLRTEVSAKTSDQAHEVVEAQMKAVFLARDAFDEIITAMDNIVDKMMIMVDTIKTINEFKDIAVRSIMNISSVSEETAASCEEVSASSEEQTVTAEQVRDLAVNLNNLAENLVEIINTFKIDENKPV